MDRAEWLAARKRGLGGSDIGAVLGLSQYRTPLDVYLEKTGQTQGSAETMQMRFGTYAEEFVAREYSAMTGNAVQRFTTMLHHPTAPILGNVDRLVILPGQKRASHQRTIKTDLGLECKTASAFAAMDGSEWGPSGSDMVPASYLIQCVTYMALTGCQRWDLAALFGNQELRVYHLIRDRELEDEIISRASEWWQRHVVAGVAPEPVNEADIKSLYRQSQPRTVEASPEVAVAVASYAAAKASIAQWEKEADAAALIIKMALQDADTLASNGAALCTWRSNKPSRKTDWQAAYKDARKLIGDLNDFWMKFFPDHPLPTDLDSLDRRIDELFTTTVDGNRVLRISSKNN